MSNLDRKRGHVPRRQREQRAFRMVQVGGAAGLVTVVGLVFAVVGVIGFTLPIIALLVTIACYIGFQRSTG